MFVTFEGIEGSGKSTLIELVQQQSGVLGVPVVTTREPGGTPVGNAIRAVFLDPSLQIDPIAEAFLVNASRAQLVADVIRPALRKEAIVLCDRFFDATVAYQGFGRGLDVEVLIELCLTATQSLAPDLTILLDVPVGVAFERLRLRHESSGIGADRMERENADFHERVRQGYLTLAKRFPRFVVLDAQTPPGALALEALGQIEHHRVHPR
ncbi:MAG TPA: dTMP kinase [Candidatus Binatia bacterium]|nr:dTMP kinase [Candidatus Binatia bacterium]